MPRYLVLAFVLVATLLSGTVASAAPIIWDFNPGYPPYGGPFTGPVGASSYTVDSFAATGLLLTAAGFDVAPATFPAFGDTPHELYWKDQGVDQHGIGLVGTSDNELTLDARGNPANYIRLDLNNIYINPAVANGQIRIQSVTGFAAWDLYGWDGLNYVLLETGNLDNNVFRPLPYWGTYRGYAVTVTPDPSHPDNNVLVDAISAELVTVPDAGSTLLLLGIGLAGLRAWRKRKQ